MNTKPFLITVPLLVVLITGAAEHATLAADAASGKVSVTKAPFGTTKEGRAVQMITLRNLHGLTAKVITYGAIIYSVEVPDKSGQFTNVTINRPTVTDYESKSAAFGAVLGRYANRIGGAQFTIEGKQFQLTKNNGQNHIHGGAKGFNVRVWRAETIEAEDFVGVKLSLDSKDGDEGYPGNLRCSVTYTLDNQNELTLEYSASTDTPTVVNLSNHAYWNLGGAESGDVLDQVLTLNADKYLVVDEGLIPTGEIAPVAGTPLDFTTPQTIGSRIAQITGKQFNGGYDHCFVVNHPTPGDLALCAKLKDPKSGRVMEVFTTEPGVQLYSANFPSGAFEGTNGYKYPSHCGLAIETQHYPDSPNKPSFPSTLLRPGQAYRSETLFKFAVE